MENHLPDEQNPRYIFSLTHSELLCKIVKGELDPIYHAKAELCNRGVGTDGTWIGFIEAEKLHFPDGRPEAIEQ